MLLKPDIKLDRVTEITSDMLRRRGITALILDVDNTLSTHHGMKLCEGLEEWLAAMRESGVKLLILSNATDKRVRPFAEKIGLDYISLGLKPLFTGYIRSLRRLKTGRRDTAIVGDQIFTDVLGGNFCGLTTVLLTPIKPEDSLRFKFKRRLERIVFKLCRIEKTKE